MKKRGMAPLAIIFIVFAIIGIGIAIFGFTQIKKVSEKIETTELLAFVTNLRNTVETASSAPPQTQKEYVFSPPAEVKEVCFVDRSKEINPYVKNELNTELEKYKEDNLFVIPPETYQSYKIKYMELSTLDNPTCVKTVAGKIKLKLITGINKVLINASDSNDKSVGCVIVELNAPASENIDMVFIPDNYNDLSKFARDVERYKNNLMSIEPFPSKKHKFNFYRVDDSRDLGCHEAKTAGGRGYIKCDEFKVRELASECPSEHIIILNNGYNPQVSSAAVSDFVKINTDLKVPETVLAHELGHAFGKLVDEYLISNKAKVSERTEKSPNCDRGGCKKWRALGRTAEVRNAGCIAGCSYPTYFRATEDSIMHGWVDYFGPVNEEALLQRIKEYEK